MTGAMNDQMKPLSVLSQQLHAYDTYNLVVKVAFHYKPLPAQVLLTSITTVLKHDYNYAIWCLPHSFVLK